jgi:hypothetical protein
VTPNPSMHRTRYSGLRPLHGPVISILCLVHF